VESGHRKPDVWAVTVGCPVEVFLGCLLVRLDGRHLFTKLGIVVGTHDHEA
jgi:hypothetical protein